MCVGLIQVFAFPLLFSWLCAVPFFLALCRGLRVALKPSSLNPVQNCGLLGVVTQVMLVHVPLGSAWSYEAAGVQSVALCAA